ncbi:MAG: hypothetical protein MPF33_05845 [Candidatus Aramenus sp.]|nr:hypothetical protein [Candidatus Aramenus sp.]
MRERERVTKLYRRLHHLQDFSISPHQDFVVFGVSTVYLGYPYFISRMVTSSLQIWSYRKLALQ